MKTKQEIFDTLISENLGMLRAAAFRILGDQNEVDDAVQEALITAWNKYSRFRSGAKLSSWLYRITVNKCCDRLRKRKREAEKLKNFAAFAENASDSEKNDQCQILLETVADLSEPHRETILTGILGGFSSAEAAAMLGCSVNALHQRIFRAKKVLKEELEKII